MKKILSVIILLIPILVLGQFEETSQSIKAETDWSGMHCRGTHGLCKLNTTSKTLANTSIVYNSKDKSLIFTIDKNKLSKFQETQILGNKYETRNQSEASIFLMENDFVLNNMICSELNIPSGLTTIKSVSYPLSVVKDSFIIIFKLN